MGNIKENKEEVYNWDEPVYLIEEEDYVEGGEDGISNRQASQLTRRTRDLFNRVIDLLRNLTKGDADTLSAAKGYADNKMASLLDSAPETLNTLNELAAALGDDPNFATTVANQIGSKVSTTDPRLSNARPADGGNATTIDGYPISKLWHRDNFTTFEEKKVFGIPESGNSGYIKTEPVTVNVSRLVLGSNNGYGTPKEAMHIQEGNVHCHNKLIIKGVVFDPATKIDTTDPRLTNARPADGGNAATINSYDISRLWRDDNFNPTAEENMFVVASTGGFGYIKSEEKTSNTSSLLFGTNHGHSTRKDCFYIYNGNVYCINNLYVNGNAAWHAGNFNPDTKADTNDVMKVLRAGKVNASGQAEKNKGWFRSERLGSMIYRVTHEIGHTNYITFATCVHSNQVHDISVISETANYTEFLIGGTSGTSFSTFNFTILEI